MSETKTKPNFDSVAGLSFRRDEISTWDFKKFEEWFIFLDFLYDRDGKQTVTSDIILMLTEYMKAGSSCAEFVYRCGVFPEDGTVSKAGIAIFRAKIMGMKRVVKQYVTDRNFKAISPITVKKYYDYPQYKWLREFYDSTGYPKGTEPEKLETKVIVPVVELNQNISPANQKLLNAIDKVVGVYEALASSITMKEINAMSAKDKIMSLNKLSYIHQSKNVKVPTKFTQININNASAQDLEKELLDVDGEDSDEE